MKSTMYYYDTEMLHNIEHSSFPPLMKLWVSMESIYKDTEILHSFDNPPSFPPLSRRTPRHSLEKFSHQVWIRLELVHLSLKMVKLNIALTHVYNKAISKPGRQTLHCVPPQTSLQPPSALQHCVNQPTPSNSSI